jgi:predicted peptidase
MDEIAEKQKIGKDRIYVTGLSVGGCGSETCHGRKN